MDIAVVNRVFETLPEDAQIEVFDFMQYLAARESKRCAERQAEKRQAAYQAMLKMKAESKISAAH